MSNKGFNFPFAEQMRKESEQQDIILTFVRKVRDLFREAAKEEPFEYEIPQEVFQASQILKLSTNKLLDKNLLENALHHYIWGANIEFFNSRSETKNVHDPLKFFLRITLKRKYPEGKALLDILKQSLVQKEQDKNKKKEPVNIPSFLQMLPKESLLKSFLSARDLVKRLPDNLEIYCTLHFVISKIIWLNKISSSTIKSLIEPSQEEIHVFLLELAFLPSRNRDRMITFAQEDYDFNVSFPSFLSGKKSDVSRRAIRMKTVRETVYYSYCPGLSFAEESEVIKQIDKIIPYQTIFVLKLNHTNRDTPYFQIWHGHKKVLMKGITVSRYVHTAWMEEKDMPELSIQGDTIPQILKSFTHQIEGIGECPELNDIVKGIHDQKNGKKHDKPSTDFHENTDKKTLSDGLLLDYGFLADKLVSYIEARPNQTVGIYNLNTELPLSKVNFLKQEKVPAPVALNKRDVTRLDMYMHVCKELAEHMKDCYTFTFSGDVIYFQKKETCTLSTAEIDKQLESFFILSDGKSCRRK